MSAWSVYETATNWSSFADIIVGFGQTEPTENLVYTGLNSSGEPASTSLTIVAYMVGTGDSNSAGNAYSGSDTRIVIPATYNDKPVTKIGPSAFRENTSIKSVSLPEGLTVIESSAFYNCDGLTSIEIPASVTSIEGSAFAYCQNLTEMTLLSPTPPILGSTGAISTATTAIYIPSGSYAYYSEATNWSQFEDILIDPAHNSESWKTIWSGSIDFVSSSASRKDVEQFISAIVPGRLTKVSGHSYKDKKEFNNVILKYEDTENGTFVVKDGMYEQYVKAPTKPGVLVASILGMPLMNLGITITKVEQYY